MAFRRKRRNRGAWLPVLPTIFSEGGPGLTYDSFIIQAQVGEGVNERIGGANGVIAIPLTIDETTTPMVASGNPGASLRDVMEGQEYMCDRVVGKVLVSCVQDAAGIIQRALVGVGLAVLPVDDAAQEVPALAPDDYDPFIADNSQAPWLWRRTWGVANLAAPASIWPQYPQGNWAYGSVMDGPHLDTKGVKRRIRKEERLFLVASAYHVWTVGTTNLNSILINYDVRLHGAMRRASNRSTFK